MCLLFVLTGFRVINVQVKAIRQEVAADKVYQLGPIPSRGRGVNESEPATQPGQSANQIPMRHFDGIGT